MKENPGDQFSIKSYLPESFSISKVSNHLIFFILHWQSQMIKVECGWYLDYSYRLICISNGEFN